MGEYVGDDEDEGMTVDEVPPEPPIEQIAIEPLDNGQDCNTKLHCSDWR